MKGQGGISWDKEVKKVWNGIGGTKDEILSIVESGEQKPKARDMIETTGKEALGLKEDNEEHLKIYRGSREEMGMKTYLHRPKDAVENVKLL